MTTREPDSRAVAVTGMALACALGDDIAEVWEGILRGKPAQTHWGEPPRPCGILTRRPPESTGETALLPEFARLAALHARRAWADAGISGRALDLNAVATVVATTNWGSDTFPHTLRDPAVPASVLLETPHAAADAISHDLGLGGPKATFVNACAAGGSAIAHGMELLRRERAEAVLVGGVNVLTRSLLCIFESWRSLDLEPCSPYTRSRGLNLAEGAAFLVLETPAAALRRGARIIGYLLGHGQASDGYHVTAPHPQGEGLGRALRECLADARLSPGEVAYVNGHGTGTGANDPAELAALDTVFGGPDNTPPVSSVKGATGHPMAASGVVEAALTLLAIHHRVLPPTINTDPAHLPPFDIVADAARPVDIDRALTVSIGFGGVSCALAVGDRPDAQRRAPRPDTVEAVITGAGVVSDSGLGRGALLDALYGRTTGAQPGDEEVGALVEPALRNRVDSFTRLVLAAARLARDDAHITSATSSATRTGLVLASSCGPVAAFHQMAAWLRGGRTALSPLLGASIVPGITAGYASLAAGIRGPICALASGDASGLSALGYAADLVRDGRADMVYVIAAEEATDDVRRSFAARGLLTTAETARPYDMSADGGRLTTASVAILVESAEHAERRSARILGAVLGHADASAACAPGTLDHSGQAQARCLTAALRRSGLHPDEPVRAYGTSWGLPDLDRSELRAFQAALRPGQAALANIGGTVGHAQSATALLTVLAALEARDRPPPALPWLRHPCAEAAGFLRGAPTPGDISASVITTSGWGGTCAALAVR